MKTVYDSKGNQVDLMELNDIESGDNYIKFPNGIAIVWGYITAPENVLEATFTFPFPMNDYQVVATHAWSHVPQGKVTVGTVKSDRCKIIIYDFNDDITRQRHARVIAIGKWK